MFLQENLIIKLRPWIRDGASFRKIELLPKQMSLTKPEQDQHDQDIETRNTNHNNEVERMKKMGDASPRYMKQKSQFN